MGDATATATTTIQIQNEERSWEKFYSFVLLCDDDQKKIDASYLVLVSPRMGILAPRGTGTGSSPAASSSADFSDAIELRVSGMIVDTSAAGKLWLLVGTEAEKWVYKLA